MIFWFRVHRRLLGEVVLHGFHESDEVATLGIDGNEGWIKRSEDGMESRTSLLRCQF